MIFPILIVEDSSDDAEWLKRSLKLAGLCNPCYVVTTAPDALAYIEGTGKYADREQYPPPKIILLDLKLPGMDGFQMLERLKRIPAMEGVLLVAISGLDDLQSIRRSYQLGANSFLAKPCRAVDIENLVQGFPGYWSKAPPPAPPPGGLNGTSQTRPEL